MIRALKATILAVFVSGALLMLLALTVVPGNTAAEAEAAPVLAASEAETEDWYYWLRAYNGHIAVFFGDESEFPSIETTIEIDTLRDVDREKLEAGISAQTYEQVLQLLEDFGS